MLLRLTSSFIRPADNTAYTAGDEISNHATAGSVVRPTFDLSGWSRGRVLRAGVAVTPASGNVIITAFNFNMLLFKSTEVPSAVGDNVTHPLTGAQRATAIGHFIFDNDGWVNPLGAYTASTSAFQLVPDTLYLPSAAPAFVHSDGANFDFRGAAIDARTLTAVFQVLAAWTPTGVANTFGIVLDLDVE